MEPIILGIIFLCVFAVLALMVKAFQSSGNLIRDEYAGRPVRAEVATNLPVSERADHWDIVLGREIDTKKEIIYRGEGHILTIGPTRSGKGVGAVIPNLLRHKGSAIVIDPKAEALRATIEARSAVGNVVVIDPWNISGHPSSSYNPLSLSQSAEHIIEDAALIADALVIPTGAAEQVFWENEGRSAISTVVMHLMASSQERSDISAIRTAIANGGSAVDEHFKGLLKSDVLDGRVARGAAQLLQKSVNEKSGVLSVCRQQTQFLDSPAVQSILRTSSFRFATLRIEPTTVFICIPIWRLNTHGRLLRLLVSMALAELSRDATPSPLPLLFIADEFAAIGSLTMFDTAFALMAGMNVKMWAVLQDMTQLQKIFGEPAWQTMVANAGVLQCFGARDLVTARYLATRVGRTTISLEEKSYGGEHDIVSVRLRERDAIAVHELMQMPSHQGLVFVENHKPLLFEKIKYFESNEDPNPALAERVKPPSDILSTGKRLFAAMGKDPLSLVIKAQVLRAKSALSNENRTDHQPGGVPQAKEHDSPKT